jgi:hypothetical protein
MTLRYLLSCLLVGTATPFMFTACVDGGPNEVSNVQAVGDVASQKDPLAVDPQGSAQGSPISLENNRGASKGAHQEELIPITEAPELQDDEAGASVTDIKGTIPQLLRGSLRIGTESEIHHSQNKITDEQALSLAPSLFDDGTFYYSGGIGGKSYDVIVSKMCYGYQRNYVNSYTYDSSGGNCSVVRWYSDDPRDCRVVLHVGVPPFKNGRCAWQVYADDLGYLTYNASNTNSAQQNTTDTQFRLSAGQTLTAGTCGLSGASASGDTYLRVLNSSGQVVAQNDDACSSLSSYLVYTPPAEGYYVLRAGCFSSGSCSGTVAWVK